MRGKHGCPSWVHAAVAAIGCWAAAAWSGERAPAAVAATSAAGQTAPDRAALRSKVRALLPVKDRARWRALGPDALEALNDLFASRAEPASQREAAVTAMARVANDEAASTLARILKDRRVETRYRAAAALALARRTGMSAVGELGPYVEDARPELRIAAARALGTLSGEQAQKALEDQVSVEANREVRETLEQSLTSIQP